MNSNLTKFFKSTRRFIGKHSPEILTGIGITGMITSTVLAVKATPRALELIEEEREYRKEYSNVFKNDSSYETVIMPDLKPLEIVKLAWKPYIPAAILGLASASCIIGASAVNYKRNAALATAYAISESTLIRYRDKVVETIGEKKEKEIKDKVAQDVVNNKKLSDSQVIITSNGNSLCMDSISGRYFKSGIDKIQKVVNELNRRMKYENYISLDEFYSELGLDSTKNSSYLGWNIDDGYIEIDYSTCLADNDEPCIVIDYSIAPKYDFDKLI